MRLIGPEDISSALPMAEAVSVVCRAFVAIAEGRVHTAERQAMPLSRGTALLMGSSEPEVGLLAKMVNVVPANQEDDLPVTMGAIMLFEEATGRPLAILDGTALTAWRTAAAAGCATDVLARPDARRALLIGCGAQARTQLLSLDAVRDLEEIGIYSRSAAEAEAFVSEHRGTTRAQLGVVTAAGTALDSMDIVTAATTSHEPVVPGSQIPPGCHVNGIGSFKPDMREFDADLVQRAMVFVEARDTAAEEAGDLICAAAEGVKSAGEWRPLGDVIRGELAGREDDEQITFYKSVGHAAFDLYVAAAVYERALKRDLGKEWTR